MPSKRNIFWRRSGRIIELCPNPYAESVRSSPQRKDCPKDFLDGEIFSRLIFSGLCYPLLSLVCYSVDKLQCTMQMDCSALVEASLLVRCSQHEFHSSFQKSQRCSCRNRVCGTHLSTRVSAVSPRTPHIPVTFFLVLID